MLRQSGLHPLHQLLVQPGQAAQQRPGQHHGRTPGQFQHAKARLHQRVVGSLLMGLQRDAAGKVGGHGSAVLGDMADLARGQPEFQQQPGDQRNGKGQGHAKGELAE